MPESPIPKALSTFLKHNEENKERESDRQYWMPLKKELEEWRHRGDS